jgi:hypothetical protein
MSPIIFNHYLSLYPKFSQLNELEAVKVAKMHESIASVFLQFKTEASLHIDLITAVSYLWNNHSNSISLIDKYFMLSSFESKYRQTSEQLYQDWQSGQLKFIDSAYNDWLMTYLPIRKFLVHAN